jgi:hypothetical protein
MTGVLCSAVRGVRPVRAQGRMQAAPTTLKAQPAGN